MTYPLTVDYSKSVKDLIIKGKYDWVNEDITEEHFPSTKTGKVKLEIELLGFDKDISSEDILEEMKTKGLESLTLIELLHLGIKYPDLQRENWIAALGSQWRNPFGGGRVPYLGGGGSPRDLDLAWFGVGWDPRWRVAAVRKSDTKTLKPSPLDASDTLTLGDLDKKLDRIIKVLSFLSIE